MPTSSHLRSALLVTCATGALCLTAGVSQAATATATAGANSQGAAAVSEIVVTAEKREENVQRVPVAISVFSSTKRDVIGIQSIQDMTNFTPGLSYSTSTDRITLRGIGRTTNVLSADAPVANYDDGLYETFAVAAGRSSLDLERVEILRGPQGTLSGRNALGGAINEVTAKPTSTPYAEARVTYGNYDHVNLEAVVSGPLNDNWAVRVYGNWEKQDQGWIKNVVPGMPSEGNVINEWYVDGQIQGKINDHLDMWTKVQGAQWFNGGGGPGAASAGWTDAGYATGEFINGQAFLYANATYACNAGSGATNVKNPSPLGCVNPQVGNPWVEARSVPNTVTLPTYISVNTQWTWHANDFDIKYIGGGTYYHYILTGPSAVSPVVSETLPVAPNGLCGLGLLGPCSGLNINSQYAFNYQELNGFWSDEVDFISTGNGPLQWVAGLYQFYQHYTQPVTDGNTQQPQLNTPTCLTAFPCPTQTNFLYFNNQPSVSDQSYAVFGQIDWKFTDTLKLTLGARYSYDRKYGTESVRLLDMGNIVAPEQFGTFGTTAGPAAGAGPAFDLTELCTVVDCSPTKGVVTKTTYNPKTGLASRGYDANWSDPSGTAGLEWQVDPDTLLYAKYGRGYKSGGFNIGIFTVLSFSPYTNSETVDSFEIGLKKNFGHMLQVNAAAYYYSYSDLQIPITIAQDAGGPTQAETSFYNVPKSVSEGFELESTFTPIDNLAISLSYSYDNAYISQGAAADPGDPNAIAPGAKPLFTLAQCQATAGNKVPDCLPDIYTAPASGIIPGDPTQGFNIPQNLAGNSLPNAPHNKVAINVLYTFKTETGDLTPSVSYLWRDSAYGTLFSRPYNLAPAWDQWDMRLTWKSVNGRYEVIAFGKNVLNTIGYDQGAISNRLNSVTNVIGPAGTVTTVNYVQGINGPAGFNSHVANTGPLGIQTTYYPTPPRTYGIEFHYKFF
jgi:iron complex outermembrane recepter protein